jgi:hypothetical protein
MFACWKLSGAVVLLAAALIPGCAEKEKKSPTPSPTPEAVGLLDFPTELRADDPTVNEFLIQAIQTCVDQDYDAFRLLWSAREEPISEQEFKRGWQANPKVYIKDLRKGPTEEGEEFYAVRALVRLDPDMVPEPERDIVMLLVKEGGKWRLAAAPRNVVKFMKGNANGASDETADEANPPSGPPTPGTAP